MVVNPTLKVKLQQQLKTSSSGSSGVYLSVHSMYVCMTHAVPHHAILLCNVSFQLLHFHSGCCFAPLVCLQELRDVNMATMQHQPPTGEHWRSAWQAANLSDAQRQQICAVKDFTCARLEALDAERKQLLEEQATLNAAAAAAGKQGVAADLDDSTADGSSDRASNRSADSSGSNTGLIERRRWEVAQQLARVNSAWRMLTQLRSQFVVMVLQPVQAARIVCAVYPYMLLGGPVYQHLTVDGGGAEEAAAECSGCYGGSGSSKNDAEGSIAEADTSSSGDGQRQQNKRQELVCASEPAAAAAAASLVPKHVLQQVVRLQAPPMRVHPAWCNLPQVLERPRLPQLVQLALAQGRVSGGRAMLQQLLPLGALQGPLLLCCTCQEDQDVAVVADNFTA
jgi:hypothetical protein